ncbi:MAG: heavy-metal-associated domain-containing protein [Acidimicrobiia bacterium]|nr:heavy metal-associated domain-containing protein [bacterium]MXX64497.1 heavy-metal-associated domain-containing protein [Acidimicrobiia bacterium]MCY3579094.1 heavy metal-associated domain-containing protein [bacterium]MCY3653206.1 heavy metal-associated domain-containing protein [bacterium]MDE0642773.1 heavy metal-associated domain-containing protein [bacterium]
MEATKTDGSDAARDNSELWFDVSGMTCGSCAAHIEKVLSEQAGVAEVAVDLAANRARVKLDTPGPVDRLTEAVEEIGYGLTPV